MNDASANLSSEPSNARPQRFRVSPIPSLLRRAAPGFLMGAFLGVGAWLLGVSRLIHFEDIFLIPGIFGALMELSRFRRALRIDCSLLFAVLLIVAYTPLAPMLMRHSFRADRLQPCPAVVVLSAALHKNKSLDAHAQDRLLKGYALLRAGYALVLIVTHGNTKYGAQTPTVRAQMQTLGLNYPVEETGPVDDTHDEALAVARLVNRHGWQRVLLVTHAWHMRRAAALFEKAGVAVVCCPCEESEYDLNSLDTPGARLRAFSDWLHEAVGYQVARWRGWL